MLQRWLSYSGEVGNLVVVLFLGWMSQKPKFGAKALVYSWRTAGLQAVLESWRFWGQYLRQ